MPFTSSINTSMWNTSIEEFITEDAELYYEIGAQNTVKTSPKCAGYINFAVIEVPGVLGL